MSRAVQEANFVETLEHRRFTEFCEACRRYGYIGLCYGSPGVGKTLSAKHYTRWRNFKNVVSWRQLSDIALKSFEGHSTLFYCPSVTNTPRQIVSEISVARDNLRRLAIEPREAFGALPSILFTYRLCARVSASQSVRNASTF